MTPKTHAILYDALTIARLKYTRDLGNCLVRLECYPRPEELEALERKAACLRETIREIEAVQEELKRT